MNSKVSREGWTFGLFQPSKQWDSGRKKERPVSDTALLCDKIQLIVADIMKRKYGIHNGNLQVSFIDNIIVWYNQSNFVKSKLM